MLAAVGPALDEPTAVVLPLCVADLDGIFVLSPATPCTPRPAVRLFGKLALFRFLMTSSTTFDPPSAPISPSVRAAPKSGVVGIVPYIISLVRLGIGAYID
jgi:hypothetical protein